MPDGELIKTGLNFFPLIATPSIDIQEDGTAINYKQDSTYYKFLDP